MNIVALLAMNIISLLACSNMFSRS
jgi:hypothetical protein